VAAELWRGGPDIFKSSVPFTHSYIDTTDIIMWQQRRPPPGKGEYFVIKIMNIHFFNSMNAKEETTTKIIDFGGIVLDKSWIVRIKCDCCR